MSGFLEKWGRKLRRRPRQKAPSHAINDILIARAVERSADFVEPHLASSLLIRRADEVRDYAMRNILPDGLIIELGVNKGVSINQFADALADRGDLRRVYGFDAFSGLSEDWYGKSIARQTSFNRGGKPPRVRSNVTLVIGWIEDTLAPFLNQNEGPIAFLHVDTDTYSPCRLALDLCRSRFVDGTLILFDEHHGYPNWENGEFKALNEVLSPDHYRYTAFSSQQAVIRIVRPSYPA